MREIKFRGKIHNGEWVYGSLVYFSNSVFVIHYEIGTATIRRFDWCYVDPDTVGQFTGLKDCNGKEIYEGDIIESKNHYVHVIFFDSEKSAFMALEKGKEDIRDACPLLKWWVERYEKRVIGNIHDNFDLMK